MAKVMIIDDDASIVDAMSAIVKSGGHDVQTMDTTEGAIEALREFGPEVLFLDVMFPENPSAGFELARDLREEEDLKELPVFLLSSINEEMPLGFSDKDIDPHWMPVQQFVEKPVSPTKLLSLIDDIAS